jgi:hypothetical protein
MFLFCSFKGKSQPGWQKARKTGVFDGRPRTPLMRENAMNRFQQVPATNHRCVASARLVTSCVVQRDPA